jgi:hypothetical protein
MEKLIKMEVGVSFFKISHYNTFGGKGGVQDVPV